jgi:hypothetical protein
MKHCSLVSLISVAAAQDTSINVNADGSIETISSLALARMLIVPLASDVENAEYEHASFWDENGPLFRKAWNEWEQLLTLDIPNDKEFMEPLLSDAIDKAFANPTSENEAYVKSFWNTSDKDADNRDTLIPEGVYATQLLTPSGISFIRYLLDKAAESGIPTRRPNGMNRNGFILDSQVNGAVPIKPLIDIIEKEIIDRVVRPVGRMLFQEHVGCNDDIEYFAFTIRYDGDNDTGRFTEDSARDVKLSEHRDASVITLNLNLNLPHERYAGSDVYFRSAQNTTSLVQFTPGMALIHLGAHRHGSISIASTAGSVGAMRYNLVVWLFGKDGDVRIAPYSEEEKMNVVERWHGCDSIHGGMRNVHNFDFA